MAAIGFTSPWSDDLFGFPGDETEENASFIDTSPHAHAVTVIERYNRKPSCADSTITQLVFDSSRRSIFETRFQSEQAAAKAFVREALEETHEKTAVLFSQVADEVLSGVKEVGVAFDRVVDTVGRVKKVATRSLVATWRYHTHSRRAFIKMYSKEGAEYAFVRKKYEHVIYAQLKDGMKPVWLTDHTLTRTIGSRLATGGYYHQTSIDNALRIADSGELKSKKAMCGKGVWFSLQPEHMYGEVGIVLRRSAIDSLELYGEHPFQKCWQAVKNSIPMTPEHVVAVTYEEYLPKNEIKQLRMSFAEKGIPVIPASEMKKIRAKVVEQFGLVKPKHWTERPITAKK